MLNVSFDILTPSRKYLKSNGSEVHKQYNGSLEYFGKDHIPYAVLAIVMVFIFNVLPLLLLLMHPFRCFQNVQFINNQTFRTFVETFNGCYCTQPRDCRHFAALYITLRVVNLVLYAVVRSVMYFAYAGCLYTLVLILVAVIRPYKKWWHNFYDILLFLVLILFYQFLNIVYEGSAVNPIAFRMSEVAIYCIIIIILSIPALFAAMLFIYGILPTFVIMKLRTMIIRVLQKLGVEFNGVTEDSLPYRLHQSAEYSSLLQRY